MRSLSITVALLVASSANANVLTNGDFSLEVPSNGTGNGWTTTNILVAAGGGWSASGGNPDGYVRLDGDGAAEGNPSIVQLVTGLSVGFAYRLSGDFTPLNDVGGGDPDEDTFAAILDTTVLFEISRNETPSGVWSSFSVDFVASAQNVSIFMRAERSGTDWAYGIDNIVLELTPEGACCAPDGSCTDGANGAACTGAGGVFAGEGSSCGTQECPVVPGACCAANGSCTSEADETDCVAAEGSFQGHGTQCGTKPCPVLPGACCLPDASCQDVADAGACALLHTEAEFQGHGSACDGTDCPLVLGACCLGNAECLETVTLAQCESARGTYQGDGSLCGLIRCTCTADLDTSGQVGFYDLTSLLLAWGVCTEGEDCPADLDGDQTVGLGDLQTVLLSWGPCAPPAP